MTNTRSEMFTDYVLVYADGRMEALGYVPVMGPGDVLLVRERTVTTTLGAWDVSRRGASVDRAL